MSSKVSKTPKDSTVLSEREKALERIKWLKSLAEQLTQEANELEAKWGFGAARDAMSLDSPAGSDGGAGVSGTAARKSAKSSEKETEKEKSKKKKRKRAAEAEVNTTEAEAVQLEKPSASDQTTEDQDTQSPAAAKARKARKEEKREKKAPKNASADDAAAAQPRKTKLKDDSNNKKGKHPKGKDDAQDSAAAGKSPGGSAAKAPDHWNVSALEGGAERQSKFMKLLGGGKAASAPGHKNPGEARSKMDMQKYQDDLQKQYDTGMRMKFEGQGQRRGLGA